jgi:hypothetical protein
MWTLTNRTPFAAGRNWVRDKEGVHYWVVAVGASFAIRVDGALEREEKQLPPLLAPEYHGEPGTSSLRRDSDLLAVRPGTDLLLDAHAHAPGGRPAETVLTTLRVGALEKTVLVHGERRYDRTVAGGLGVTATEPFVSKPIRYELAYGGWDKLDPDPRNHRLDARNPIGRGFAARSAHLLGQPVPATQYPDGDLAQRGPAGFGPIDRAWSPRRELAGTYDEAWSKSKKPLLADDYDERFALSAPADQQVIPHLRGGERVELVNLSAAGRLTFELPRRYFTFTTRFGGRSEEHRGHLTTVFIEPEAPRVFLVWQTSLVVRPADVDYLDTTAIGEKEYVR